LAPNFAKATPCLRLRIALSEIERNLGDAYRKVHGKSARIKLRSHTFADFDPAARTGDASSETYTMVRNFRALHNWIN
jgi:hypothetical protein